MCTKSASADFPPAVFCTKEPEPEPAQAGFVPLVVATSVAGHRVSFSDGVGKREGGGFIEHQHNINNLFLPV
jgi:hypothetical protein